MRRPARLGHRHRDSTTSVLVDGSARRRFPFATYGRVPRWSVVHARHPLLSHSVRLVPHFLPTSLRLLRLKRGRWTPLRRRQKLLVDRQCSCCKMTFPISPTLPQRQCCLPAYSLHVWTTRHRVAVIFP